MSPAWITLARLFICFGLQQIKLLDGRRKHTYESDKVLRGTGSDTQYSQNPGIGATLYITHNSKLQLACFFAWNYRDYTCSYHSRWKPSPVPPPKSTSVLILINPAKMPTCSLTANIVFRHMRSYATAGSPSVVNLYQASACMFQVLQFSPLTLPPVMPSPVRKKPALCCAHLPRVSVSKNLSYAGYLSRMFWMETFEKLRNTVRVSRSMLHPCPSHSGYKTIQKANQRQGR